MLNTGVLTQYLGYDLRVYVCPALEPEMGPHDPGPGTVAQWSYAYNRYLGGAPASWYTLNYSGTWANSQPYKMGGVPEPTSYAVFVDMGVLETSGNTATASSGVTGIGNGGNALWFRDDPSACTGAYAPPNAYQLPAGQGMQMHNKSPAPGYTISGIRYPGYRGVVNVAFLDGSVRSVPWQLDQAPPYKPMSGVFVDPLYPTATW